MKAIPYYIILFVLIILAGCNTEEMDEIMDEVRSEASHSMNTDSIDTGHSRSGVSEQNLLTNGGLEEWNSFWTPEMPTGWSLPSNEFVKRNKTIVYEGTYSAKMQSLETGNTARLEQKVQVSPHDKIRIRFQYYVEQWKSKGARTYCYFRTREAEASNLSTDELESFYDKDTYYIIRGGGYGLTYFPHELKIWQTFDETIEVPPTATYFVFGINSYNGTIIYVDDCWVINVTEPVSTGIKPVTM